MNQYDFCQQDIDELIQAKSIPLSPYQSLRNSRISNHNYQSINDALQWQKNYEADSSNQNSNYNNGKNYERKNLKNYEKLKQIQQQEEKKILSQCTFKPKTNIKSTTQKDFNRFLMHQQNHIRKVQQNKLKLKQELESKKQKITFQPNIKKLNHYKNNKNVSVFERLNNKKSKQGKNKFNEENTFHPKINKKSQNLIRHQSVQQILYKDAQERRNRQKSIQKQQEKTERKQINFVNEQYIAQKFMKQYFSSMQQLDVPPNIDFKLQKQTFINLLYKLRFLTKTETSSQQSTTNQLELANQAYSFITQYSSNARNIFVFLLAVIGVYHINAATPEHQKSLVLDGFDLCLNENEGKIIFKKYNKLYRNRLHSQQKGQFKEDSLCTFKPEISKHSTFLAEKNRKILLEQASKIIKTYPQLNKTLPQNGVITHAQFLILNKRMKNIELENQRNAKIENTMKQCTFKPKISKSLLLKRKSTFIDSLTKLNNQAEEQKRYQSQLISNKETQKQPQRKNKPCLILDINFGDKEDQIILRPQDIYRLPEIAKHYADKYYIDQESEIELLQMLADQFNNILSPGLNYSSV